MEIVTAEDAVEAYKSLGEWQYADREATWKWMFNQGKASSVPVIDCRTCDLYKGGYLPCTSLTRCNNGSNWTSSKTVQLFAKPI